MLRGVLLGSAWGLVLGGVVLGALSLTYPETVMPPPVTSSDAGPDVLTSQGAETSARLPSVLPPPERGDSVAVTRPGQDDLAALSAEDLKPGAAPQLTAPDGALGVPDGPQGSGMSGAEPVSPVLPSPLAAPPAEPAAESSIEVSTLPAEPQKAAPGETVTGFPVGDLTETLAAPDPIADPAPVEADDAPAPVIAEETAEASAPANDQPVAEPLSETAAVPAPVVAEETPAPVIVEETADAVALEIDQRAESPMAVAPAFESPPVAQAEDAMDAPVAEVAPVQAPRPRIPPVVAEGSLSEPDAPPTVVMPGSPAIRLTESVTTVEPARPAPAPEPEDTRPPIDRYAAPFENPEDKPLLSIVLLASAEDGATEDLPDDFPYPVTLAVPVDLPDAEVRMRRYRDAGFEVLALAGLPAGATPKDVEIDAASWFRKLPEVVGLMEHPDRSLQSGRANGEELAKILSDSGHGLLLYPEGLDTTRKFASRLGVPAATVFRDLDAEGQNASVVRRFLDNAAFKAGQGGAVILVARLRPETIEALLVWGLADRASRVAVAPVSYALKASQ